jgi:hypothetical protein
MIVASTTRACRNADAAAVEIVADRAQHLAAEIVLFEQVAEVQNRRLIRRRCAPQIDANEAPLDR